MRSDIGTELNPGLLNHKFLEKGRGFFNHLSLTYEMVTPCLRGFHNSIDSWRDDRDIEGWKMEEESSKWVDILNFYLMEGRISESEYDELVSSKQDIDKPPKLVLPAPRLFSDLQMLEGMFSEDTPAVFPVRFEKAAEVFYGFFDASGSGLGSMLQGKDESQILIRIGTWSEEIESETSSNWKEFANLVRGVIELAEKGVLSGALLILFTDNSIVEGCIAKGNSPSKKLFELVLELRQCQMKHGFGLYAIHVSGSRIIRQGTDGVSRGDLQPSSGVEQPVRYFAPIHLTAFEQSVSLKEWVESWTTEKSFTLDPSEWFFEAHDLRTDPSTPHPREVFQKSGVHIWTPPPCVANVALEQLRLARLKRQVSTHIFIVPRLFYSLWRR